MHKLTVVHSNLTGGSAVRVPNSTISDPRLSLEALGVLAKALDKPRSWDFTDETIGQEFGLNKQTASRIIRELEDSGYLFREIIKGDGNSWELNAILYPVSQLPRRSDTSH